MAEEVVGLMSPETQKMLGDKLKFKNVILELVDDPLIRILDDNVLQPLSKKLKPDVKEVVVSALAEVVNEMSTIEI